MSDSIDLPNQEESLSKKMISILIIIAISAFSSIVTVSLLTTMLVEGKTKNYLTTGDIDFLQQQNASLNDEVDQLSQRLEKVSVLSESIEPIDIKIKELEQQMQEQKSASENSSKTLELKPLKGLLLVFSLKKHFEKGDAFSKEWESLQKLFENDSTIADTMNALSTNFQQEILSSQKLKNLLLQTASSHVTSPEPNASNETQSSSTWKNFLRKVLNKVVTIRKANQNNQASFKEPLQKAIFALDYSNVKEAIDILTPYAAEPAIAPSYQALQNHLNTQQSLDQLEQKLLEMTTEPTDQGAVS